MVIQGWNFYGIAGDIGGVEGTPARGVPTGAGGFGGGAVCVKCCIDDGTRGQFSVSSTAVGGGLTMP